MADSWLLTKNNPIQPPVF